MRVLKEPEVVDRPAAPLSLHSNETGPFRFVQSAIRNSPWIVIAVTAHIVALATLSVIYVKSTGTQAAPEERMEAVLKSRPADEEPLVETKPEDIIDRDKVPAATTEKEAGVPNIDEVIFPDEEAGRRGPVSDEKDVNREAGVENLDPEARPDTDSGSSGGTSIGPGRFGHPGTGTPSAYLSRVAGKNGRGGGGPGDGGKNGPGGNLKSKSPDIAVLAALKWLKNHQAQDGRWDSDGFDAHCSLNRCDGAGEGTYDPGLTGLSLLAYVGAGHTHQNGPFRDTVKSGIRYLRDVQDSEGCFGPRTSQHFLYNHACASLAMVEAYGMTGARILKEPAQRGIGFVLRSRNPYMAWRYNVPADGDNDTSVTGWMVMALKSAKLSGLDIEDGAVKDAITWVEKMTEPEFGRTGYQQRGGPPARTNEATAKFPAGKSESLTAVGLTTRIFGGRDVKSDEMIGKGADLLAKCLPKWDVDQGTIDYYYWYYGSLAMFQVGGERWKKWNESVKTALLDHQRLEKDRCEFGSWDPIDPWSPEGGRVYATAINCLTMEVYYRYPVLGVRSEAK